MENVGGQAVIEGVMMQSKKRIAIAVRNPKGKIIIKSMPNKSVIRKRPFSFPIIRGIIALVESLSVGIRALNFSASVSTGEKEQSKIATALSVIFAFAMALFIFKFIPLWAAQAMGKISFFDSAFVFVEGIIKVMILLFYVYLIGLMPDVRKLYSYHGAEHKAVNCYESRKKLTAANAMKFSTIHARCGTSFLLLVVLTSIAVYAFLPSGISLLSKYALRLLALPLIAGISYELLKLGAGKGRIAFALRLFSYPGLLLQKITTQKPDKKQVEVAIAALKKAIKKK